MTPGAVSQNLARMRAASLIASTRANRYVYRHLAPAGISLLLSVASEALIGARPPQP